MQDGGWKGILRARASEKRASVVCEVKGVRAGISHAHSLQELEWPASFEIHCEVVKMSLTHFIVEPYVKAIDRRLRGFEESVITRVRN